MPEQKSEEIRFFGPMYKNDGKRKEQLISQSNHVIYQTRWKQHYGMVMYGCQWNRLTGVYLGPDS